MGHLLILQGKDRPRTEDLQGRAYRVFQSALGLEPEARVALGDSLVTKFGRTSSPSTGVVSLKESGAGACGAGAWTLGGLSPKDSLVAAGDQILHNGGDARGIPDELDGSFVLAVWGGDGTDVRLVTDRVGTLHCYYSTTNGTTVVCTSSLVLAALFDQEWDPVGVNEFLATGSIFEDRTLFQGIRKLRPASAVTLRGGKILHQSRYWNLADVAFDRNQRRGSAQDLAGEMVSALRTIVKTFGVPCLDLTGGYDSRAVLAAMLELGGEFGTVVNGPVDHPDVRVANRIARAWDLSHRHQLLPADWESEWWNRAKDALRYCDGEYDILEYAAVLEHHGHLASDFSVSVNGSGGEFCKGYWWELLFPWIGSRGHFDARRVASKRFAVQPLDPGLLHREVPGGLADHFAAIIRRENHGLEKLPNTAQMDNVYLSLRMHRWQGRIASSTNRIWPCVSPFMFRKPLETALATPPGARTDNRMSCDLIEYLNPRLAKLPLAQGYPASRMRIGNAHLFWPKYAEFARKARQKIVRRCGFHRSATSAAEQPLARLVQNEEVRDHLMPKRMLSRELYNEPELESLCKTESSAPRGLVVGRVLTLERLARVIYEARLVSNKTQ